MTATETRITRLNDVSARQVRDPDAEFDWSSLGRGQILPDELLSVAGLDLDLTPEQRVTLAREETAAMLASGVRFEAVLNGVFSLAIARAKDIDDVRHVYMLHEVGEETRHQRAFLRLRAELAPKAVNPFDRGVGPLVLRRVIRVLLHSPALFGVLLLAGEEIPDLLQKLASEHPDTDELFRSVNKYHRAEEARHLSFARAVLPEQWARASFLDRWRVRHVAPRVTTMLFETMVHPGVYATIGLPAFKTWRAANRTPERIKIRQDATRPILKTLLDHQILKPGRVPKGWRVLCGVDRDGAPVSR